MNVFIVGLGLIGASYAAGFKAAGHTVDGYDTDVTTLKKAQKAGLIKSGRLESMQAADVIVLALYPKAIPDFLIRHQDLWPKTALITDVSGVKNPIESMLVKHKDLSMRYVSHHPMAGKAQKGFDAHDGSLFQGANCILIERDNMVEADLALLKTLLEDLGFGRFITVDAQRHDRLIALTSQLTHAIAVALMHSDTDPLTPQATGDSFRDLTRIAEINAPMWCELFLENKTALTEEITRFQAVLERLKHHILEADDDALIALFESSTRKRKQFDNLPKKG